MPDDVVWSEPLELVGVDYFKVKYLTTINNDDYPHVVLLSDGKKTSTAKCNNKGYFRSNGTLYRVRNVYPKKNNRPLIDWDKPLEVEDCTDYRVRFLGKINNDVAPNVVVVTYNGLPDWIKCCDDYGIVPAGKYTWTLRFRNVPEIAPEKPAIDWSKPVEAVFENNGNTVEARYSCIVPYDKNALARTKYIVNVMYAGNEHGLLCDASGKTLDGIIIRNVPEIRDAD
jgi:hypothetical protein